MTVFQKLMSLILSAMLAFSAFPVTAQAEAVSQSESLSAAAADEFETATAEPSATPTATVDAPSSEPTTEAAVTPTVEATTEATVTPTIEPTTEATETPTAVPTAEAAEIPTSEPTAEGTPLVTPSLEPQAAEAALLEPLAATTFSGFSLVKPNSCKIGSDNTFLISGEESQVLRIASFTVAIYSSTDYSLTTPVHQTSGTGRSFVISANTLPAASYTFKLTLTSISGETATVKESSVGFLRDGALEKAAIYYAQTPSIGKAFTVRWRAIEHADSYEVVLKKSTTEMFRQGGLTECSVTIPAEVLIVDGKYTVTVMAFDSTGHWTASTNSSDFDTAIPALTLASIDDCPVGSAVTVSWEHPHNHQSTKDRYRFTLTLPDQTSPLSKVEYPLTTNSVSLPKGLLRQAGQYCVRVDCTACGYRSEVSATFTMTGTDMDAPTLTFTQKPDNPIFLGEDSTLAWEAVPFATTYQIVLNSKTLSAAYVSTSVSLASCADSMTLGDNTFTITATNGMYKGTTGSVTINVSGYQSIKMTGIPTDPVLPYSTIPIKWNLIAGASEYHLLITGPSLDWGADGKTFLYFENEFNFSSYGEGDYTITLWANDEQGNELTRDTQTFSARYKTMTILSAPAEVEVFTDAVFRLSKVEGATRYEAYDIGSMYTSFTEDEDGITLTIDKSEFTYWADFPIRLQAFCDERLAPIAEIEYTITVPEPPKSFVMNVGEQKNFYMYTNYLTSYFSYYWYWSSNISVVAFDAAGRNLIAKKPGTSTITIWDAYGRKVTLKVRVGKRIESFTLSGPQVVTAGKSITLKPSFEPAQPSVSKLLWQIDEGAKVAAISSAGKLTAKKTVMEPTAVTVRATATDGSRCTATYSCTVYPITSQVQLFADDANVTGQVLPFDLHSEERTLQLKAASMPDTAAQSFTWKSSSPKLATVDENGLVTIVAIKDGRVKITATAADGSGKSAFVNLTITRLATDVTITGADSVAMGKTIALKATLGDASNKKVTWDSSDSTILTVSASGVVKGKVLGSATVTATAADGSGQSDSIHVDVCPAALTVDLLDSENASVAKQTLLLDLNQPNARLLLHAATTPNDASQAVTWSSSSAKVATVDPNGEVCGLKDGIVTIKATAADGTKKSASCKVKVTHLATAVTISGSSTVAMGKTIVLKAVAENASNKKVTWSSSDVSVLTVSASGAVKGKALGSATVTATAADGSGRTDTFEVHVSPAAASVAILDAQKQDLSKSKITLSLGEAPLSLQAQVMPAQAGAAVEWSSSSAKIATVDQDGVVQAVKVGAVTIKAKAMDGSGKYAYCTVQIVP